MISLMAFVRRRQKVEFYKLFTLWKQFIASKLHQCVNVKLQKAEDPELKDLYLPFLAYNFVQSYIYIMYI